MSMQIQDVHLQTGEFFFGSGHVRVHTLLGTCIAIVIWHPRLRLGGMCHYLLPTRGGSARNAEQPLGMYADDVMSLFERELTASHTHAADYVVKLFGGGKMFTDHRAGASRRCDPHSPQSQASCHDVACKNVKAGRDLLSTHGFRIAVENVGGHGSRQVVFDVWTGDVWVKHGQPLSVGELERA